MTWRKRLRSGILVGLALAMTWGRQAGAYSLLTHEQLIDLTWKSSIVPLLLSRYPTLTPAQLEDARAYAYGGCVIQDIGYYPFGDASFSNLTHYVRSGDFVVNLFRDAGSADELAFAVGALSHYIGDSIGHSEATNLAVPVEFPALRARYGAVVSYGEGEHQHVQTEFAFDIGEVAHHRLAPVHYLRHVGLQVPLRQLSLAFYQTYGLGEDFTGRRGRRINVAAYRFAVHSFIPRIAYALTLLHRRQEPSEPDSPELADLEREVSSVSAENHWDAYRREAGIGTYALAGLIWIVPKIGPLKLVAVKGPTKQTEAEYIHSVVRSTQELQRMLSRFTPPPTTRAMAANGYADTHFQAATAKPQPAGPPAREDVPGQQDVLGQPGDPRHPLPNRDLDTGRVVQPGGYALTDATYANLLHRLTRTPSQAIPKGVKDDIERYYADLRLPITTKKNPAAWAQVQSDLVTLKGMATSNELEPFPTYGGDKDDVDPAGTASDSQR